MKSVKLFGSGFASLLVLALLTAGTLYAQEADPSYYENKLCKVLNSIMEDSDNNFKNVINNTTCYTEGKGFGRRSIFQSKIKVPDALATEFVYSFMSYTCRIKIAESPVADRLNSQGEAFMAKMKKCLPDYYFFSKRKDDGRSEIQIGKTTSDGYYGAKMVLFIQDNEDKKSTAMYLYIYSGKQQRYYTIKEDPQSNDFIEAIYKIYDDILNNFDNIKGTEHKSDDFFNPAYKYELNFKVPYAHMQYIDAGRLMALDPDRCMLLMAKMSDREQALDNYREMELMLTMSFGSEFVKINEITKSDSLGLDEMIAPVVPANAEKSVIYLRKKERCLEEAGLCALVMQKDAQGNYLVYLVLFRELI